jgi:hypothetical protein
MYNRPQVIRSSRIPKIVTPRISNCVPSARVPDERHSAHLVLLSSGTEQLCAKVWHTTEEREPILAHLLAAMEGKLTLDTGSSPLDSQATHRAPPHASAGRACPDPGGGASSPGALGAGRTTRDRQTAPRPTSVRAVTRGNDVARNRPTAQPPNTLVVVRGNVPPGDACTGTGKRPRGKRGRDERLTPAHAAPLP